MDISHWPLNDFWLLLNKTPSGLHVRQIERKFQKDILYVWIKNGAWFYIWGKCGRFELINKWLFEVNSPYGQSDFTVNPGPTISFNTAKVSYLKQRRTDWIRAKFYLATFK